MKAFQIPISLIVVAFFSFLPQQRRHLPDQISYPPLLGLQVAGLPGEPAIDFDSEVGPPFQINYLHESDPLLILRLPINLHPSSLQY